MTRKLYRFALFAAAVMASTVLVASEEILYWMIDDSASITIDSASSPPTTMTIGEYFGSMAETSSGFAARVRVTGGDIQDGDAVFMSHLDDLLDGVYRAQYIADMSHADQLGLRSKQRGESREVETTIVGDGQMAHHDAMLLGLQLPGYDV